MCVIVWFQCDVLVPSERRVVLIFRVWFACTRVLAIVEILFHQFKAAMHAD
jgi:hypothetical protein